MNKRKASAPRLRCTLHASSSRVIVNAQTILQIRLPTGAPAVRRQVVTASDPPNFRETARGDSAPGRLA